MALQPFTNEQLNYFKFAFVVLNEFPKVLQTFKHMWDDTFAHHPGYHPWNNSITVRNMLLGTEGGKIKIPTHLLYEEWDCTALFQAPIYAQSLALPDRAGHHRTLSDLYLKHRKPPHKTFLSSVLSPRGNNAEKFALTIDQLRLLWNAFCHSFGCEIDKKTFDQYMQHTKDTIKGLGVTTDPNNAVGSLTESDFPTEKVLQVRRWHHKGVADRNHISQGKCGGWTNGYEVRSCSVETGTTRRLLIAENKCLLLV